MGDLHGLREHAISLVGRDRVWRDDATLLLHSYDASLERGWPDLIVSPRSTGELRALVAAAHRFAVPYAMRGAGTGYSGGALPAAGGMVILTSGLDRILSFDTSKGLIRCEPGVVLADVQRLAAKHGWRYPPDPSSHQVCTIGGNVAENAGGPHALGGGSTANYVVVVDVVRPDGSIVVLDERDPWQGELDLCSLIVGAEGTLGAVAAMTLRLVRPPELEQVVLGTFTAQEGAVGAVADVFTTGLLPSALDMLTGGFIPGDPSFADDSLLFVGVAGQREEVETQVDALGRCVGANGGTSQCLDVPGFLVHRAQLVRDKVRRMVATTGRPRYYLFDAVAPRSQLAVLMDAISTEAVKHDLPLLNTFHAGDGNVHPTPFYDPRDRGHRDQLLAFSAQVLRACARLGGSLSGEHGIGSEKRHLMAELVQPEALDVMRRIKHAFDPADLCNPGKVVPEPAARGLQHLSSAAGRSLWTRRPPRARVTDAVLEITDGNTTFADVTAALADTPYDLAYEPLGGSVESSVFDCFDRGLPGLREPAAVRSRDLIVGAVLRLANGREVEVGRWCSKDVAGYELRKLVYGARGRLGALVALRLRLLPRPSDSRLVSVRATSVEAALDLTRAVQALPIPFAYLGVVVQPGQPARVVGRAELRGGSLDRHVELLASIDSADWSVTSGNRWTDPPVAALANGTGELRTALWSDQEAVPRGVARLDRSYIPAGARHIWWKGKPSDGPRRPSDLEAAVVHAFQEPGP